MFLRNKGLQVHCSRCILQSLLWLTHPTQHLRQGRIAHCLGRSEGRAPLHLCQGLLILSLVKRDKAQDDMVQVEGVIEGEGPLYCCCCELQGLSLCVLL